ncbi:hypothetical protein BI344_16195 [Chromobacterium sphagni]|uniref:Uncharacterized protein n=1 Tax=Chromobacterium sphagni TaxID=1903179 RepID=A0ABX3CC59_9NEIS|nr:hypothetical protein BI344_16195 [Chromobacterium sphagni]
MHSQLRQYQRVAHTVAGHLDSSDFQRFGVNAQVCLAPLPTIFGAVLFAFPLAFAEKRDAGAIDASWLVWQNDCQRC